MRLDRLLVHAAGLSRTLAQRAIRGGEVIVDDVLERDPSRHVSEDQQVLWRGNRIAIAGKRYLMLHKPAGYVSATRDAEHPTVLDLINAAERHGLHPAGRLDLDTTGLVLLTDDGAWSHRITSPRHHCPKTYRVTLADPLDDTAAENLRAGVLLQGERTPTAPAQVEGIGSRVVRLTITEGMYHQIKRMAAAVGHHVVALHRERIGPVNLDPVLEPGGYRSLTAAEVAALSDHENPPGEAR